MTKEEFKSILDELDLTQGELALFMEVDIRTVRRWARWPEKMNVAAKEAILAWHKLHKLTLAWRPDSIDLVPNPETFYRKIKDARRITLAPLVEDA